MFNQLSRVTVDCALGPTVRNSFPGHLALVSEGPRVRPAIQEDSGSCLRACEVDLWFWVTRARALWPAGMDQLGCLGPVGVGCGA